MGDVGTLSSLTKFYSKTAENTHRLVSEHNRLTTRTGRPIRLCFARVCEGLLSWDRLSVYVTSTGRHRHFAHVEHKRVYGGV
jgi:hypothetical protein